MVKKEVVLKRAEKCEDYLCQLNKISKKYSYQDYITDPLIYASSERFLHLTIEALLDIGNHIISDDNLGKVNFYRDIPEILFENDYLNKNQKQLFIKIIGFRNILVHDYIDLDHKLVYQLLNNKLTDLKDILKQYLRKI